ncbi:AAA family ATPase [Teichococcus aestuarii]|nr:AAA family ATPase [Pseudoroseomonas aestuarii]
MPRTLDLDWIGPPDGLQPATLIAALTMHLETASPRRQRGVAIPGRLPSAEPARTAAAARSLLEEIHRDWRWPKAVQREHADLLVMMAAALAGDAEAAVETSALLQRRAERLSTAADGTHCTALRLRLRMAQAAWRRYVLSTQASQSERLALPVDLPSPAIPRRSLCAEIPLTGDPQMDQRLRALQPLYQGVRLLPAPDPAALAARMEAEMPQAAPVIRWMHDTLALRRYAGQASFHLPPLLLHGPPGCGKSHLARRLLELAGIPHHLLSVAGSSDVRLLLGTARGWASAQASLPALLMARQDAANPGLVIDEIDKAVEHSQHGAWTQALLGFLEPETARGTLDEFLGVEVDTRHITWILTANDISRIPAPLRSRLACFAVAPPTEDMLPTTIRQLLEGIARDLETTVAMLPPIAPERLELARQHYKQHRCLRQLRALLQALLSEGLRMRVLH